MAQHLNQRTIYRRQHLNDILREDAGARQERAWKSGGDWLSASGEEEGSSSSLKEIARLLGGSDSAK